MPEPPDGALNSMLSINIILFVYLYPVVRLSIIHLTRPIFDSLLAKNNRNAFVQYDRRRREKCRPMPTLYVRAFATADDHSKDYFSWDKDGIPFVIYNSATAIICSQHRLFIGPLVPT